MAGFDMFLNDVLAAGQAIWRREADARESAGEMPGSPGIMIDEQAFSVLYRRTAPALRAYAARVLGSSTHADDIVQESYLRLVRSPPATGDPQRLRAFLFRVASRLIVDHWRRSAKSRCQTRPISGGRGSCCDAGMHSRSGPRLDSRELKDSRLDHQSDRRY
jgi:RNA polymerase sigma factor (sigma-70 family)